MRNSSEFKTRSKGLSHWLHAHKSHLGLHLEGLGMDKIHRFHQIGPDQEQRDLVLVYISDEPFCMIERPLFLKSLHVIIAKLNHNPSPRHCCLHVCVCGCVPPGDSMAMALVQRRTPDAHNFLFPRRHPISGLEIMELRDDPRNSLNRPDIWSYLQSI